MSKQTMNKIVRYRAIYGASADVDDVDIACGPNYIHWLPIAKRKLIKREVCLMNCRLSTIHDVILSTYQTFMIRYDQHGDLITLMAGNKQILLAKCALLFKGYMKTIGVMVSGWDGVNSSKQFTTFRKYFQCHRRAFDQKKIQIAAVEFLLVLLKMVDLFAEQVVLLHLKDASSKVQPLFVKLLSVSIAVSLFEARFQPANTRAMLLVPALCYRFLVKEATRTNTPAIKSRKMGNEEQRILYLQKTIAARQLAAANLRRAQH